MKKLIKECPPPPHSPSELRLAAAAAAVVVRRDVVRRSPDSRVIFFIDTFQMRLLKARQSFSLSLLFNDDDEVVTFNHMGGGLLLPSIGHSQPPGPNYRLEIGRTFRPISDNSALNRALPLSLLFVCR